MAVKALCQLLPENVYLSSVMKSSTKSSPYPWIVKKTPQGESPIILGQLIISRPDDTGVAYHFTPLGVSPQGIMAEVETNSLAEAAEIIRAWDKETKRKPEESNATSVEQGEEADEEDKPNRSFIVEATSPDNLPAGVTWAVSTGEVTSDQQAIDYFRGTQRVGRIWFDMETGRYQVGKDLHSYSFKIAIRLLAAKYGLDRPASKAFVTITGRPFLMEDVVLAMKVAMRDALRARVQELYGRTWNTSTPRPSDPSVEVCVTTHPGSIATVTAELQGCWAGEKGPGGTAYRVAIPECGNSIAFPNLDSAVDGLANYFNKENQDEVR